MIARAAQTSPRLESEPGGVFSYVGDTPPPCDPGGGGGGGPLTRLVRDIFRSSIHGSPSAPVCFAGSTPADPPPTTQTTTLKGTE